MPLTRPSRGQWTWTSGTHNALSTRSAPPLLSTPSSPPPPDVLSRLWEYVETCTPSWLDYGMVAFSKDTVLRHRKRAATVGGLKHRVRLRICTYVPARLLVCTYVPRNPSLWQCYLPPGSGISSRASDSVSAGLPSSSGLSTSCKHVRHGSSTATSPAHFVANQSLTHSQSVPFDVADVATSPSHSKASGQREQLVRGAVEEGDADADSDDSEPDFISPSFGARSRRSDGGGGGGAATADATNSNSRTGGGMWWDDKAATSRETPSPHQTLTRQALQQDVNAIDNDSVDGDGDNFHALNIQYHDGADDFVGGAGDDSVDEYEGESGEFRPTWSGTIGHV